MSGEEEKKQDGPDPRVKKWIGGTVAGIVAVVIAYGSLFTYGDPRSKDLDTTALEAAVFTAPGSLVAGDAYYRISARAVPAGPSPESSTPGARLWNGMVGPAWRKSTATRVVVSLETNRELELPVDGAKGPYVLLDTVLGESPQAKSSRFLRHEADDKAVLRLTVTNEPRPGWGFIHNTLAWFDRQLRRGEATTKTPPKNEPVTVFVGGPGNVLDASSRFLALHDPKGRVAGHVELGIEARDSLIFAPDFVKFSGVGENSLIVGFVAEHGGFDTRDAALQRLVDANTPDNFLKAGYKEALRSHLASLFGAAGDQAPSYRDRDTYTQALVARFEAECRDHFAGLKGNLGLGERDAALLTYLLHVGDPSFATRQWLDGVCGDDRLGAVLKKIGAPPAAKPVPVGEPKPKLKPAMATVKKATPKAKRTTPRRRVAASCYGATGKGAAMRCKALNEIAREWRDGTKLLQMKASRRHVLAKAGLEEPTPDMRYVMGDFDNRRRLLIYVALSKVQSFACFRHLDTKIKTMQALIMMQEGIGRKQQRVDVMEFVFDLGNKITKFRRRPAMQADIAAAKTLPRSSRCRSWLLPKYGKRLKKIIDARWKLPIKSG